MKVKLNIRKFIIVLFLIHHSSDLFAQQHKKFTNILSKVVKNGLVNYEELKENVEFRNYLQQLSETKPEELSKNDKLAFWINAYNAFTLQIVSENYPIKSITDLHTGGKIIGFLLGKTVWDKEFITINKRKYSLNDIEHNILRKMNEPRIHFAIVCASISCPELLNEAYEGSKIEEQLEQQTRKFINDESKNYFDTKKKRAYISEIFNWFDEDFGEKDENVLRFLSLYLPEQTARTILNNINQWKISYKDYNWNLNSIK